MHKEKDERDANGDSYVGSPPPLWLPLRPAEESFLVQTLSTYAHKRECVHMQRCACTEEGILEPERVAGRERQRRGWACGDHGNADGVNREDNCWRDPLQMVVSCTEWPREPHCMLVSTRPYNSS